MLLETAWSLIGTELSSVKLLLIRRGFIVGHLYNFSEFPLTMTDLSLEFLMGRTLDNAMLNVGLKDAAKGELFKIEEHRFNRSYRWSY